jgi:predicted  nucleic acid-binding Zn-ribbon protein
MNTETLLQIILATNVVVNAAAVATAIYYYLSTRYLREALKSAAERDGQQYAQSFQSMLWQEKKTSLEKEVTAYKKAVEDLTRRIEEANERFSGLEQAYHELKDKTRAWTLETIDKAEKKKRSKKNSIG